MAEEKIPLLDSNGQSTWRDSMLRIIKPLSQKEVLYEIHKLEGAKKVGPGDEFYRKNKAVLSLFIKGDREKLKLWFIGSKRPGVNWLHRFAQVVKVTTGRLWDELKAASGGQKQQRRGEWHQAFSGIKAHKAWVEPRLLLPSDLKPLGEPELSLSDLVKMLSLRISGLSGKKTMNQTDSLLKRLRILGPKGSGARALASHLATSFWRALPLPAEEKPKQTQSRAFRRLMEQTTEKSEDAKVEERPSQFRIVVVDAQSDRELLNYGDGDATLEIIVQRPTAKDSNSESTSSLVKKDELTIEVLPWTVTELRHLAARLSELKSIKEKTREALSALGSSKSGQTAISTRHAPSDDEVGYAAEAIELLAALANSDKAGSWDQKTYSAARAQRDWQIAARTPGASVLGGIDQQTAEKLLAGLLSEARKDDGSWTFESASSAINDVLDRWNPKDRPGIRELVKELRDLKNNREEKALSDRLWERMAELDGKVVVEALCQSDLLISTDDRVKIAKAEAVVRIAARGFAQEKRSPWSEELPETMIFPGSLQLARELTWAGMYPELVLEPLSKMPPYVSEEAAQIAVAMCSRVEAPLSSKALRFLEPLWKRCLADMNRLIQSASGFGKEIEAVFEDLTRLSWNQVNQLPELDLNDEALTDCSLSVKAKLAESIFGGTQGEFRSLGEEKSNLCCFMALAPFQTGQSLLSALKESPELVKLRNQIQRMHLKSRRPILWEVVDEMAISGSDEAQSLLIEDRRVSPELRLRHARAKATEEVSAKHELTSVLVEIFRNSWDFFRTVGNLREEVTRSLNYLESWAQSALLGSSMSWSLRLPDDLDVELAAFLAKTLERPLMSVEDALDLAKKAKCLTFLERLAQLPFELLPNLDLGLICGYPVLRVKGGGFALVSSDVDFLLSPYDGELDLVTATWTAINELAVRAAHILLELGQSEAAERLIFADELDDQFISLRLTARWTEAVELILHCEKGEKCPIHQFASGKMPRLDCCVEPRLSKLFTPRLIDKLKEKKSAPDSDPSIQPILNPPLDLSNFPFPMRNIEETRQGARGLLQLGPGHRYQFALLLAHYDPELAGILKMPPSLLPKLSETKRQRVIEKTIPKLAGVLGVSYSELPAKFIQALTELADEEFGRIDFGFDPTTGEMDPEFRNAVRVPGGLIDSRIREQLVAVTRRRIGLSRVLLKYSDSKTKRKIFRHFCFGPKGEERLPQKTIVLKGWTHKKVPLCARDIRKELLLDWLSDEEVIDLCWDIADSQDKKAALVNFAVKSIPSKGRGAPNLEFWRPWGHEALKSVPPKRQEYLLEKMVVTQRTAPILGDLLKSRSLENPSKLCVRLSNFDTKHPVFKRVIKAWANSENPWESFQNFEKMGNDDAWLESFANLANSTSKVRWLKSSFENLWQKHVEGLAQRSTFEGCESNWPESVFARRDIALLDIAEQRSWLKDALKVAGFPLYLEQVEKAKSVFTEQRIKSWLSIVSAPVLEAFLDFERDENRILGLTYWARRERPTELLSWARKRCEDLFHSFKPRQSRANLPLNDRLAVSFSLELDLETAVKFFEPLSPRLRKSLIEQVSFSVFGGEISLRARKLRWELLGG